MFVKCSYTLALEFQQKVVDAWASHGSSAKDELKEAIRLLEELKKKAFGPLSEALVQEVLSSPKAEALIQEVLSSSNKTDSA